MERSNTVNTHLEGEQAGTQFKQLKINMIKLF